MIRSATKNDAKVIAQVIVSTWQQAYIGIIDSNYPQSMKEEKFIAIVHHNISHGEEIIFVYEDHGQIQGFISGKLQDGPYDCEIVGFYILPEYQHKGIGRLLLNQMKSHFRNNGCRTMIIWTLLHAKNNDFYKNQGGLDKERKTIEIGECSYPGVGFAFQL